MELGRCPAAHRRGDARDWPVDCPEACFSPRLRVTPGGPGHRPDLVPHPDHDYPTLDSHSGPPSPRAQLLFGAKPIFFGRPLGTAPFLPESVGQCRDLLLLSIVSGPARAMPGRGLLMLLLWMQVGLVGMLQDLSRAFMPGQMVLSSVMFRPGAMGVGRQVLMLSSYLL
jgi:hypothetical protein